MGHAAKRPRLYRSDTDFTFTGSNLSRLLFDNNNVAIVKKRKKTKKRKKRKIWGEGCFGERPDPKITTSLFDFWRMAVPRCWPRPTRSPEFYSRPGFLFPEQPKAIKIWFAFVVVIGQEPLLRLFLC
jgi:hypothetical protein